MSRWKRELRAFYQQASLRHGPDSAPFAAFAFRVGAAQAMGYPVCADCGFPGGKHAPDCGTPDTDYLSDWKAKE